jgi:hypothetical protein
MMSNLRWTETRAKEIIESWKASGQDKKSFCKLHGVCYSRFLYWNKRIGTIQNDHPIRSGLVRLEVLPDSPVGKVSITGPNGLTVYIDACAASVPFLKALLTA